MHCAGSICTVQNVFFKILLLYNQIRGTTIDPVSLNIYVSPQNLPLPSVKLITGGSKWKLLSALKLVRLWYEWVQVNWTFDSSGWRICCRSGVVLDISNTTYQCILSIKWPWNLPVNRGWKLLSVFVHLSFLVKSHTESTMDYGRRKSEGVSNSSCEHVSCSHEQSYLGLNVHDKNFIRAFKLFWQPFVNSM